MPKEVGIVIVNWNTGELLKKCLLSLDSLSEKDTIARIVVIDNNSSDDSFYVAQKHTYNILIDFIHNSTNEGFARACNKGIIKLQEAQKECHVLLLNPDTQVKPKSIAGMLDVFQRNKLAAVVGPKLLNTDGTLQRSVRRLPTWIVLALMFIKLHRILPSLSVFKHYMAYNFDYEHESDVEQVMGAAFLIQNTALKDIGLLDERFMLWFEEVDFCARVLRAHRSVVYTPNATIIHHGGISFNQRIGISKSLPFLASAIMYARKQLGLFPASILTVLFPFALALSAMGTFSHLLMYVRTKKKI